jgi:hypothetical protein
MRFFFFLFLLVLNTQVWSQINDSVRLQLKLKEDSLISYFKKLRSVTTDQEKQAINDSVLYFYRTILNTPGSFAFAFDSIKWAGSVYAPDKNFRVINWNVEMADGTHRYYGFIQPGNANSPRKFFELKDRSDSIKNPEGSVLSAGKWFGGLYYKILKNKVDDKVYYTMLALQYKNLFTTRKFIDALYFDQFGNPVLGAPIFQVTPKTVKVRLVFEYSALVVMNLRYDEVSKRILFDHLAPSEPKYNGVFEFYGPDLSTDGLIFENKKWNYITNIELRKPYTNKPKPRTNSRVGMPVR